MKKYELLTIFKPNLDAEEIDKAIAKVEELIAGFTGSVIDTDKIGRKKLAYDVQKFRDGFFVNQVLTIAADKIAEFKKQLKLNENILRFIFIETAEKAVAKK